MTISVGAPNNTRHSVTALGEAGATTIGRTEAPPSSHQDLRSSGRPSTEHRSRLGSEPRLLSPSTQGETKPELWLVDYRLACQLGGTNDDNLIIWNLPLFLSDSGRAWLEHLQSA
jgi:hypothetical protein